MFVSKSKVKSAKCLTVVPSQKKQDRLALYTQLKADDETVRTMNTPYQFPLQVYGDDGKTYILEQFADQDGIFRFHVLQRNGPYSYDQVYSGDPFMLKTDPGENVGDKSAFLVSHYIGNENSTDVLSQSGSSPIPNSDTSQMKNVKINWEDY